MSNVIVPKSMDECINSLYGALSFLKNSIGYDAEANAIESARASLMRKEDLKKCPKCGSKNVDLVYPTQDEIRIYGAPAGGLCLDCGHEWQIEPEPDYDAGADAAREDEIQEAMANESPDEEYPEPDPFEERDEPPDSDPCATCNGQCEQGFPCHAYGGCEP